MQNLLKKPSFIIIIISIAGFISTTTLKKKKQIFFKKYYNTEANRGNLNVTKGEKYTFAFSTTDEESEGFAQWPLAEACIKITDEKNNPIVVDTIAHGGFENVGVKRAMAYEEYEITIDAEEQLLYQSVLINGDESELIIYKNLEDWRNMLPALFIIGFIIGIFLTLRKKQK